MHAEKRQQFSSGLCRGAAKSTGPKKACLGSSPMFAESRLCVHKGLSLLKGNFLTPPPWRSPLSPWNVLPHKRVFVDLGPWTGHIFYANKGIYGGGLGLLCQLDLWTGWKPRPATWEVSHVDVTKHQPRIWTARLRGASLASHIPCMWSPWSLGGIGAVPASTGRMMGSSWSLLDSSRC